MKLKKKIVNVGQFINLVTAIAKISSVIMLTSGVAIATTVPVFAMSTSLTSTPYELINL